MPLFRKSNVPATQPAVAAPAPLVDSVPARNWAFPELNEARFTYRETVRANVATGADDFRAINALGVELLAARGYGFGGVILAEGGIPATPPLLDAQDAVIDGPRRSICAAGSVSHVALGLPSALDLGGRNGSNLTQWGGAAPEGITWPNQHLFGGFHTERRFEMLEIFASVISLDLSAATGTIATLEHLGSSNFGVTLAIPTTGERRLLTTLSGLSGSEAIRFSPNDLWLLISTPAGPIFVETSTGRHNKLACGTEGGYSWWPGHPHELLAIMHNSGNPELASLSLKDGQLTSLGPLVLPDTADLPSGRRYVADPQVDPTARWMICGTSFGPSDAYQDAHGSRARTSILDLETRELRVQGPPFVADDERLEREHANWRWIDRPQPEDCAMGGAILSDLAPPETTLPDGTNAFIAGDAHDLCTLAVKWLIDDQSGNRDPNTLRPEALRAYEASCRYGRSEQLVDWVSEVAMHFFMRALSDQLPQSSAPGWKKFALAEQCIREGRPQDIDWHADAMKT